MCSRVDRHADKFFHMLSDSMTINVVIILTNITVVEPERRIQTKILFQPSITISLVLLCQWKLTCLTWFCFFLNLFHTVDSIQLTQPKWENTPAPEKKHNWVNLSRQKIWHVKPFVQVRCFPRCFTASLDYVPLNWNVHKRAFGQVRVTCWMSRNQRQRSRPVQ